MVQEEFRLMEKEDAWGEDDISPTDQAPKCKLTRGVIC
jgi:hypothetical protein